MLNALTQELSRLQVDTHAAAATSSQQSSQARQPGVDSRAAQAFQNSAVFQRALQQLLNEDVEGCAKDGARALALKAAGNTSYSRGQHQAAAQRYSDALVWLPSRTQHAEAARVHANRAQCLLKLAAAAADARAAQDLAAAAVDDCTAALSACADNSLQHKVLFRRASARLLLHQHTAAAADCEAAASAPGVPAAAVRECRQLQQQIAEAAASATKADNDGCAAPAAATAAASQSPKVQDGRQEQQQQQQQQQEQQLDQLLRYHQQQAQLHIAQQQQPQQGLDGSSTTTTASPAGVSLRCRLAPGKGRTLVAGSAIPPGTLLLAEMPLAAVPTKAGGAGSSGSSGSRSSSSSNVRTTCSWCFDAVQPWRVWPCEGCPLVLYCSAGCREAAAAAGGHAPGGIECGRPWLRLLPAEALLASRCLAAAAAGSGGGAAAWLEQQQATLLASLVHHPHDTAASSSSSDSAAQPDEQQQQLVQTVLAHLVAAIHHRSAAAPPAAAAAAVTPAGVLRCLQQIHTNGIAIRPLLSAGDRWGCGLYPLTAALVNHDCDPNCSIRFSGRQLLLACILGAAAGDELTISYGPQLGTQTTRERQALLQRQYGFACTCSGCSPSLHSPPGSRAMSIAEIEAGLNGLKCCCGGGGSACKGAVVPSGMQQLPPGIVSLHACDAAPTSSDSSSHRHCGAACGWEMPDVLLSRKLQELESAAAAAEKGCALMAQVEALQEQQSGQQQQQQQQSGQQQQLLGQALQLLQQAAAIRQTHLHFGNQLRGCSHHQAGAAAAAAAAGALAARGDAQQHLARAEEAVQALEAGLVMRSEEDVVAVLQHLQRLCSSQGSISSCVAGALRTPGIMQPSGVQEAVEAGLSVIRITCSCSQQPSPHDAQVQGYLVAAGGQLLRSVRGLCWSQQPGSLQLASEAAAACAACAGLLVGGEGRDVCHWCSQLQRTGSVLHKHAAAVFALHMPGVF